MMNSKKYGEIFKELEMKLKFQGNELFIFPQFDNKVRVVSHPFIPDGKAVKKNRTLYVSSKDYYSFIFMNGCTEEAIDYACMYAKRQISDYINSSELRYYQKKFLLNHVIEFKTALGKGVGV